MVDSIPEMRKSKKRKARRARLIGIAVSILILALVTISALYLLGWGDAPSSVLYQLITGKAPEAVPFQFEPGGEAFAALGGGVAVASSGGLQVYSSKAELVFSEVFELGRPAISAQDDRGVAYDMGGTAAYLFGKDGVTARITAPGKIISATVNKNGYLALTTQYDGYKGLVTVYDRAGSELYKWYSGSAYVLSAVLSPDNREMAVLTLGQGGSRVVFFTLDSEQEKASCFVEDAVLMELQHLGAEGVLAIGTGELVRIAPDGTATYLLDYSARYLETYALWDGKAFLALKTYSVGDQGVLAVIDKSGAQLGALEKDEKILSVSASGEYIAVLYPERLVIYNRQLEVCAQYEGTAGAAQVLMRGDGIALALTKFSAQPYRAVAGTKEEERWQK
ncbi:MAG: hypothetical protein GX189_09560 [Clostridiales bacterium]|nr:hypothetical protein [Clostridiales bacterium]